MKNIAGQYVKSMIKTRKLVYMTIFLIIISGIIMVMNIGRKEKKFNYGDYNSKKNNVNIPYRLYTPADSRSSLPLIVYLHGAGERGIDNESQLRPFLLDWTKKQYQKENPCHILAPQCSPNDRWIDVEREDIKKHFSLSKLPQTKINLATKELIDYLIDQNNIDTDKIYIIGYSMGAGGVWDMLARYPNFFSASIAISGTNDLNIANSVKSIPLWIIHGEEDTTIPAQLSKNMYSEILELGGEPNLTILKNTGHSCLKKLRKEKHLYSWLLLQQKKND